MQTNPILAYIHSVRGEWSKAFRTKCFASLFIVTMLAAACASIVITSYLPMVEHRAGVQLADPLLLAFPALDVTVLTFIIMYMCSVLGIVVMLRYPFRFGIGCLAYAIMLLLRTLTMYLVPLDAPPGMIVLIDPFIGAVAGSDSLTRDLFFSGHTSTMFIFGLAACGKLWKPFFVACSLAVGALVIVQHVHYTVDVVAAFFFAYGAWSISERIYQRVCN